MKMTLKLLLVLCVSAPAFAGELPAPAADPCLDAVASDAASHETVSWDFTFWFKVSSARYTGENTAVIEMQDRDYQVTSQVTFAKKADGTCSVTEYGPAATYSE